MASPSRSGSVAMKTDLDFLAAAFSSLMMELLPRMEMYWGSKSFSRSTAQFAFGKVDQVALGGQDDVIIAQILVDGLGFGGGLDDDQLFTRWELGPGLHLGLGGLGISPF